MIETWTGDVDCVVFLQTIEHVQDPDAVLARLRELIGPGGVAYVSTPNVLTLAPAGHERSGNPWHVREYRPEEFRALCERHFDRVDLLGLFHARKLRLHQLAIERAGWDAIHARLRDHQAVLRPLHARHLRARLPPAPRPARAARSTCSPCCGHDAAPGALAIVLHTHMPYVEGFGTWPFGEEWLWEALATCYLPLLDMLDAAPERVTLSVTPVLGDQLEAPGALARCAAFLRELRPESHRRDIAAAPRPRRAAALEYSAAAYERAADALAPRRPAARLARARAWTSAATHAVLPLLATSGGVGLQLATGIAAHRAASASWGGGLWLPECAHAPWLDALLEQAGVRATCVDLTDVLGRGAPAQLRPLRSPAGPLLVPIDREVLELVWSDGGYPAHGAYRDTHRLTEHRHQAWAVDGDAVRPGARRARRRGSTREDFVARAAARVRGGGVCVVALDTELLGTPLARGRRCGWRRCSPPRTRRPARRAARRPARRGRAGAGAAALHVTSWGTPRDLTTWSAPGRGRARVAAARRGAAALAAAPAIPDRALRELLALQSSDWAFLIAHGTAGPIPARARGGPRGRVRRRAGGTGAHEPALRNLAPYLAAGALAAP